MLVRLIGFIILFSVFLIFVIFNLGNKCDINFGFTSFSEVPVFLTAFASFIAGMICSLPFAIRSRFKKKTKTAAVNETPKKQRGKKEEIPELQPDSTFSDGGPYGVN